MTIRLLPTILNHKSFFWIHVILFSTSAVQTRDVTRLCCVIESLQQLCCCQPFTLKRAKSLHCLLNYLDAVCLTENNPHLSTQLLVTTLIFCVYTVHKLMLSTVAKTLVFALTDLLWSFVFCYKSSICFIFCCNDLLHTKAFQTIVLYHFFLKFHALIFYIPDWA